MLLGLGAALPLAACHARARAGEAADEWAAMRARFDLEPGVINLDNGWTCTAPRAVHDVVEHYMRAINRLPARQLATLYTTVWIPKVKPQLAAVLGVPASEIALMRNTTEAIGTVLLGYPFAPGDELVCSTHDYYHMLEMVEARGAGGVTIRRVDIPVPAPSVGAIVDAYAKAITPRTKLVLVTHVSNRTGQVMPVAEIADLAHRHGAEVVCDAAQSFAILDHRIPDLRVDYYCASMHKWLASPVASGVLWMKPAHIAKIPPRFGSRPFAGMPMAIYEAYGSVNDAQFVAISAALDFHAELGITRKAARIGELVARLRAGLQGIRGIKFYTVDEPWASSGLLTFELPNQSPKQIQERLWSEHKVLVQAQAPDDVPAIKGVRVSPAIYTTTGEIDRGIEAIRRVA